MVDAAEVRWAWRRSKRGRAKRSWAWAEAVTQPMLAVNGDRIELALVAAGCSGGKQRQRRQLGAGLGTGDAA